MNNNNLISTMYSTSNSLHHQLYKSVARYSTSQHKASGSSSLIMIGYLAFALTIPFVLPIKSSFDEERMKCNAKNSFNYVLQSSNELAKEPLCNETLSLILLIAL
ncbi:hypothetical protein PACTADRAFT_4999 [Pachysolen tannophilus NRRL Y-2460]|uniref:Uncharacterized protein n=1 Tax=Pachysolen tannophilus NRRL Y-2460 TaxID=669874 RepID=A0A1E4TN62_PACTA|nr:hypothetical protein PACTADRAFT_4999 [Pachysolen tannophilus NRRL Y-2460]